MSSNSPFSIAVFCAAASDIASEYFEQTARLGCWIGQQGWRLVYGGARLGLMECVAYSAKEAGGTVVGVVPDKLVERNIVSTLPDEIILVHSLGQRKELMLRESDVFIALPGGIGTLDEIFHVMAAATIGYHTKRVVLYNVNGFWNSLCATLDEMLQAGFVRGEFEKYIAVANNLKELEDLIK